MEEELEHALEGNTNDPNNTTIVGKSGNDHNNINTKLIEKENTDPQIRRSTRITSANPKVRSGKLVTH